MEACPRRHRLAAQRPDAEPFWHRRQQHRSGRGIRVRDPSPGAARPALRQTLNEPKQRPCGSMKWRPARQLPSRQTRPAKQKRTGVEFGRTTPALAVQRPCRAVVGESCARIASVSGCWSASRRIMEVPAAVDAGLNLVLWMSLRVGVARRASPGTVDCCPWSTSVRFLNFPCPPRQIPDSQVKCQE